MRGVNTKTNVLYDNVSCANHDIILLSETWIKEGVFNTELFPNCYNVYRCDRAGTKKGGGVLIATKNTLLTEQLQVDIPINTVEMLFVKVTKLSQVFLVICIYIPPASNLDVYYCVFEILENLHYKFDNLVIFGDFNVSQYNTVNSHDSLSLALRNFLEFSNLTQHNSILNSNQKMLDLIITSENMLCKVSQEIDSLVPEDAHHPSLCCIISIKSINHKKFNSKDQFRYNFKKTNLINLYEDISLVQWDDLYSLNDIEQACDVLYFKLYEIFDKHVPIQRINSSSSYPPWFDKDIIAQLKLKNKLRARYLKSMSNIDKLNFVTVRNSLKSKIKLSRENYVKTCEANLNDDPSKFWGYVNSMKSDSRIPGNMKFQESILTSSKSIVDGFATHFSSVFNNMDGINNVVNTSNQSTMGNFYTSDDSVLHHLRKLKPKLTSGLDNIPAFILKDCASCLTKPLTFIFNQILTKGVFPKAWKNVRVSPIFKSGSKTKIEDYRPIAILSNFSKVFESILTEHISWNVRKNISPNQYGFISKRSTTCNLFNITQYLSHNLDNMYQTDVIYTDMTKAFDRIHHGTLIKKLCEFNINNNIINVIESYLFNRSQVVEYKGITSFSYSAKTGIPQGSNLGPLLFSLFVNDIGNVINSPYLLYADDLKIFRKIVDDDDYRILQDDLNNICHWCKLNGLSLNIKKCSVMTFSRKLNTVHYNYAIEQSNLQRVEKFKDLGVMYDSALTFNEHIGNVVKDCFRTLGYIIRNSRLFSSLDTLTALYNVFICSKLEYCSVIWAPQYAKYTALLESVQRKFLKFLYFKKYNTYPDITVRYSSLLQEFNFITITDRHKRISCLYLYKLVNNLIDDGPALELINFHIPRLANRSCSSFSFKTPHTSHHSNSPLYKLYKSYHSFQYNADIFGDSLKDFTKHVNECLAL